MNQNKPPIFWISEILFMGLVIFCVLQALELRKPKDHLGKVTGSITMLQQQYLDLDFHYTGLVRFIKVNSSPEVFEVNVTDKTGEGFSPEFEKLDSLKTGDTITIYYARSLYSSDDRTVRTTHYIDRGSNKIYVDSQSGGIKLLSGMAMFCLVCMGGLFILKNEGHIV